MPIKPSLRTLIRFFLGAVVVLAGSCRPDTTPDLTVDNLRCEYRVDPMGIDRLNPRLSWVIRTEQNDQSQSAWQILAASSPGKLKRNRADLWNSGKVISGQSAQIEYRGPEPASRQKVYWKVRVWDNHGKASEWSQPATWSMGLLHREDWQAQWIFYPLMSEDIQGGTLRNGYHSPFHPGPSRKIALVVDLGQVTEFDTVALYPARPHDFKDTPGFLFPVRFRIDAATDSTFADARIVTDHTRQDYPNPGADPAFFTSGAIKGRFIRISVEKVALRDGNNWGLALNEIEIRSQGRNRARGARVTASEAIITGDWKPEYLTDGLRTTPRTQEALPALCMRKEFDLPRDVRSATAYVTARGLYELHLNGTRVGDQLLAPEWTAYDTRIPYQTFDVTDLLREGENVVSAFVAEGWYAGNLMAFGRFAYGKNPALLARIEITLSNGKQIDFVTDSTWKVNPTGPITSAGIYHGETFDARLDPAGWQSAGFDDSQWQPVTAAEPDTVKLVWLPNEPIRIEKEIRPVALSEPVPGAWVADFGQNLVGWCRITGDGEPGKPLVFRHGEAVNPDGTLYTENLRRALQTDRYIPAAAGSFTFEPRFTYHGFRYLEITGLTRPPTADELTAKVFRSSSPVTGFFECSDSSLNRLMENILWTQRANLMSSPNDCPQRDERFGWMGDIQSFAQTAIFNMDLAAFFTKFLQDTRDDQAVDGRFPDFAPHPGDENKTFSGVPAWGDAGVFVPWTAYVNYADTQLLRNQLGAAARWVDYIHRNNPDLIWRNGRNNDYNDWLSGDWIRVKDWPQTGGEVPRELFATAFFARSAQLVAKMAKVTGNPVVEEKYGALADRIADAFRKAFLQPDGSLLGNTQGGYALALHFGLLPDSLRSGAASRLATSIKETYHGHLSTGIQTTHRAMLELSRNGYHNLAWDLITSRSFPSWLYMVDNGATTIWERWDGYVKGRGFQDPGMNSLNHWALGSVGEWMWRYIIGLNPDEEQPGWKHFTIAPMPGGGVTWAKGGYESIHGTILCAWKIESGKFILDVVIPPGSTATIRLPGQAEERQVGSGVYHMEAER